MLAFGSVWLPPSWLWGLNHAIWLTRPVYLGLSVIALLAIWTPLGSRFGHWLSYWLDGVLLKRKPIAYGLVPLFGAAVFWLFREPTHMLGDGQTLAVMVAADRLYHGFDFMTYHLVAQMYQAFGGGGEPMAFRVFAGLGGFAGAGYLAAAAWSARRLAEAGAARILLYALLVFGAPIQLFMGYAEVYAPLSVALLVFLTFFILYYQGRCGLSAVSIALGAALFFHLNALFLTPLMAMALVRPPVGDGALWPRRLLSIVWPPLASVILVCLVFMASGYDLARFKVDFGHTGSGILVPLSGSDGLFTGRHLKDTLNLLLLLAPVPLVLLLLNARRRLESADQAALRNRLLVGTAWLGLLLTLVHMKLGTVRDWDLFAPHIALVVLAGWYVATTGREEGGISAGTTGRLVIVAFVLVIPWLAVNASAGRALNRLEAVGGDLAPYPQGLLHEQMAYYHQTTGEKEEVTRHYRRAGEVCPANPRFHAIYGTHVLNLGDTAEALVAYERSLVADSTYVYGLTMAVTVQVIQQDYAGVLPLARRLHRLQRQDVDVAEAHGIAAQRQGLMPEAIAAYRRTLALAPARLDLLERVGGLYFQLQDFGAAELVFRDLMELAPDQAKHTVGVADAVWQNYQQRPTQHSPVQNRSRLTEVVGLVERMIANGRQRSEDVTALVAWRNQVQIQIDELTQ